MRRGVVNPVVGEARVSGGQNRILVCRWRVYLPHYAGAFMFSYRNSGARSAPFSQTIVSHSKGLKKFVSVVGATHASPLHVVSPHYAKASRRPFGTGIRSLNSLAVLIQSLMAARALRKADS